MPTGGKRLRDDGSPHDGGDDYSTSTLSYVPKQRDAVYGRAFGEAAGAAFPDSRSDTGSLFLADERDNSFFLYSDSARTTTH